MPAQIICKSRKKGYAPDKVKYDVFQHSRASNSKVNSLIWPELVQDFMAVVVINKFEDDSIK